MRDDEYPPIPAMIEACLELANAQAEYPAEVLNTWECKFCSDLESKFKRYGCSVKQLQKLKQIYDKVVFDRKNQELDGEDDASGYYGASND